VLLVAVPLDDGGRQRVVVEAAHGHGEAVPLEVATPDPQAQRVLAWLQAHPDTPAPLPVSPTRGLGMKVEVFP